jgi:hypothetical protein
MADEEPQVIEEHAEPQLTTELTDAPVVTERDNSGTALLEALLKGINEAKARGQQGEPAVKALSYAAYVLGAQLQQLRTNIDMGKDAPMIHLPSKGGSDAYHLDLSSIYYPPENTDHATALGSFGDMREVYNALVAQTHKGLLESTAREMVVQEKVPNSPSDLFINGDVEGTHVRINNRHAGKSGGLERRIFPLTLAVEGSSVQNLLKGFDQLNWNQQIDTAVTNKPASE